MTPRERGVHGAWAPARTRSLQREQWAMSLSWEKENLGVNTPEGDETVAVNIKVK